MTNEKLVRDKIPDRIHSSGEAPHIRTATGEELDKFLRMKIVEEAKELLDSNDIDELVDIYEALEAFMKFRKIDSSLIEIQMHAKRMVRGGFDKGYILRMED